MPGYKHDDRFRNRFFALHNLQPADIQYIRDSYNTSQYDFLLTDLTFSAPPLEISNTSLGLAANHTVDDVSAEYLGEGGRNHSVEPVPSVEGAEFGHTENASLEESYEQNSTYFRNDLAGILNHSIWSNAPLNETFLDKSFTINETYSLENSTASSQNEGFDFKTHFMFLLLNTSKYTLKTSPSKFELKEFYDQITNTDRFKNVVENLRAKLKEINELESNLNNQREYSTLKYIGKEGDGSTTENIKPTEKPSKWNHVRRFFIHTQNQPINNSFPGKSNLKEVVEDVIKNHAKADNLKIENEVVKPSRDYPEFLNDNEKFNKIFEDVDKIEDIIDNDRTINTFHNYNKVNEDGLIDYYNIDMPFSSFHDIPQRTVKMNDSLDSVFKDIGDTISSIMNNNNEGKQEQKGVKDENNNGDSPTQYYANNFNKTTVTEERKISNKTHFWEKIHFWKVPQNLSIEVERSLKHFFFREKNQSTIKNENHPMPLKENYLFNLNSKNNQETVTTLQKEPDKTIDYLIDSSESEFSKTEELYNNSYVFMVHKENLDEPAQLSSWKKVVNFFHREKGQPVTLDLNVQDIPGNSSSSRNSPSEFESVSNQNIVNSSKIIRLPENLMPQVLDQRQTNETEWFLEDFDDYEDKIEEHKSSDGSFLFFFK